MARSTARTGKLKRSKARRATDAAGIRAERPLDDPSTRHASVGELLAALDGGRLGEPAPASVPTEDEAPADDDEASPDGGAAEAEAPADDAPSSGDGEAAARPRWAVPDDPDDLGLTGYEDDDSEDEPGPAPEVAPVVRADGVELSDTLPMAPEDDLSRVKGQASPRLMSVIESLLFASERPLTVRDIRRLLKEPTVRQVQLALKQLQIDTAERGVVLSQVAGGFRLRTNPSNAQWVQRMLAGKPARLSRSQLEALAVIAYRQPITKAEIDHVRGVDCGAVLKLLLERTLVRIVGRKEEPGRPHLYGTTVEFLEFFNLRSLRDMPDLHEFRELTDESRATLRTEFGEDVDEVEAEVLGQEVLPFDPNARNEAPAEPTDGEPAEGASEEGAPESSEGSHESEEPASEPASESAAESEEAAEEEPEGSVESEDPESEGPEDSVESAEAAEEEPEGSVESEDSASEEPEDSAESEDPESEEPEDSVESEEAREGSFEDEPRTLDELDDPARTAEDGDPEEAAS